MKRLALMLASILVVSAVATAKEVIVQPEVIEEPVVIVEEVAVVEEPVMMTKEVFKPTGYVNFETKYYAPDENTKYADGGNYLRNQLSGAISVTPTQKFEYRVRGYQNLRKEGRDGIKKDTEMRLRYYFNHGQLGDTKISSTTELQHKNYSSDKNYSRISEIFQFSKYFSGMPSWLRNDSFKLIPYYEFASVKNNSDYSSNLGFDIKTYWGLPGGVELEFNVYNTYYTKGYLAEFASNEDGKKEDSQFDIGVEVYLYKTFQLYSQGKFDLSFYNELGYEKYDLARKNGVYEETLKGSKIFKESSTTYQAYYLVGLLPNYKVNEATLVYGFAGAELKNRKHIADSSAARWGWQPQVTLGFNVAF